MRCRGRVPARGLIEQEGEPGVEFGRIAGARGEDGGAMRFGNLTICACRLKNAHLALDSSPTLASALITIAPTASRNRSAVGSSMA